MNEFQSPFQSFLGAPADGFSESSEGVGWTDAPEQVAFREAVLAGHVKRSRERKGQAHPDLAHGELRTVAGTNLQMATRAAEMAGRLLNAANEELVRARQAGDADALATTRISAASGYRGCEHQARLWRKYFTRYYRETDLVRQQLTGGRHSSEAVAYMLDVYRIPSKIAAPGYSNHQAGIAIDFLQERSGGARVRNSTRSTAVDRWRETWFFRWLQQNASSFGFEPYSKEPWHWEFRSSVRRDEVATLQENDYVVDPELEDLAEDERWGPEEAEEPEVDEYSGSFPGTEGMPRYEQMGTQTWETSDGEQPGVLQLAQLSEAEGVFDAAVSGYRHALDVVKRVIANPTLIGATGAQVLPSFGELWRNHPANQIVPELVPCRSPSGLSNFGNQCVIRLGVCLTGSGISLASYTGAFCWFGHGRAHPLRVEEMKVWLNTSAAGFAGRAQISRMTSGSQRDYTTYAGQTGVVAFIDFYGVGNQGDHIDLWNGSQLAHGSNDYFHRSREIWFWRL